MFVTQSISWLTVLLGAAFTASAQLLLTPLTKAFYHDHHGVLYPEQSTVSYLGGARVPLKSFRPPYLLPFLPPIDKVLPFVGGAVLHQGILTNHIPTASTIFTPNTDKTQTPETPGQVDSYKKELEEEAKQAEQQLNELTTGVDFGTTTGIIDTSQQPTSFVTVKVQGDDKAYTYGYSV